MASHLATKSVKRLTGNKTDVAALKKESRGLLVDARSKDALAEPTKFLPQGGWSRARTGGGDRRDRIISRLIG